MRPLLLAISLAVITPTFAATSSGEKTTPYGDIARASSTLSPREPSSAIASAPSRPTLHPTTSLLYYSEGFEAPLDALLWQSGYIGTAQTSQFGGLLANVAGTGNAFHYNPTAPCQPTILVLNQLPPHTSISLSFLLAIIGTWDGLNGSPGPDRINVSVDNSTKFSHVFGISTGTSDFTFTPVSHTLSGLTIDMTSYLQNIPHSGSSLTIAWYADGPGWQGGSDESWGIDNLRVTLNNVSGPPAIDGITPTLGLVGDSVVVTGSFFPPATTVSFNGTPATILRASEGSTTAVVPAGATSGRVTVGNGLGSATSAQSFAVHQSPTITSVSPQEGSLGAVIIVRGSHFDEVSSLGLGIAQSSLWEAISETEIHVTVGPNSVTGNVMATPMAGAVVNGPSFTVLPLDPSPHFEAIYDVPRDQGGHVFLQWRPSDYDRPYHGRTKVSGYRVWRRAMPPAQSFDARNGTDLRSHDNSHKASTMLMANPNTGALEYWEALNTLPAAFLNGYAYAAKTTEDSLPSGFPYTAFMLQTVPLDETDSHFFFSEIDSGYSVDNLPPKSPLLTGAQYTAGQSHLHWLPNTEPDLNGYVLYRGTHPDFTVDVADSVAFVADTGYVDMASSPMYYKIAAVDRHGNRSLFSTILPIGISGGSGGPALSFSLGRPFPNPSDGSSLNVEFTLPTTAPASLEVLDVSGRCVLRHDLAGYAAGRHTLDLAKRTRLATGLYLVKLQQSGMTRTIRTTVLN